MSREDEIKNKALDDSSICKLIHLALGGKLKIINKATGTFMYKLNKVGDRINLMKSNAECWPNCDATMDLTLSEFLSDFLPYTKIVSNND